MARRKEIWIPEVAHAYTCQASAVDGHSHGGGRERSEGGALDEKKEALALSMQRRSVHNGGGGGGSGGGGGGGGGGTEATGVGKLEWHQALSSCPGLPILVIGTKSELADAASRVGGVTQDAKLLSPLSYAGPLLRQYRQQTGGLLNVLLRVSVSLRCVRVCRCMRVSAATGVVDLEALNDFFLRVFDRATSGHSPVRRWQPPITAGDGKAGGGGMRGAAAV